MLVPTLNNMLLRACREIPLEVNVIILGRPLENWKLTVRLVDEDPREALLKYAAVSEDDPVWVGKGKQLYEVMSNL